MERLSGRILFKQFFMGFYFRSRFYILELEEKFKRERYFINWYLRRSLDHIQMSESATFRILNI